MINAPSSAFARGRKPDAKAKQRQAAPVAVKPLSRDALLAELHRLIGDLDYDGALALAGANVKRTDLDDATVRELRYTIASSLAVLGDTDAAERAFVALLTNFPDFVLPDQAEPKIITPFRSAQAVVGERSRKVEAEALATLRSTIHLELETPASLRGGEPAVLSFHLADPAGAVQRVDLNYRRAGEQAYASLPLQPTEIDVWRGEISGDWTSSRSDYDLEFYAEAARNDGTSLVFAGATSSPLTLAVSQGELQRARPFYRSLWFWAAVGVGVAAASVTTYLIVHNSHAVPNTDLGAVHF